MRHAILFAAIAISCSAGGGNPPIELRVHQTCDLETVERAAGQWYPHASFDVVPVTGRSANVRCDGTLDCTERRGDGLRCIGFFDGSEIFVDRDRIARQVPANPEVEALETVIAHELGHMIGINVHGGDVMNLRPLMSCGYATERDFALIPKAKPSKWDEAYD